MKIEQEIGTVTLVGSVDELESLAAACLEAIGDESEAWGRLGGVELRVVVE